MSRRQEIIQAIVARMKSITRENGFQTDAGLNVYEWLGRPLHESEGPSINIRDVKDQIDSTTSYSYKHSLQIQIIVSIFEGDETSIKLRQLMSDVLQVFSSDDDKFPPLEVRHLNKTEMEIENQGQIMGGALLDFTVFYKTPAYEM